MIPALAAAKAEARHRLRARRRGLDALRRRSEAEETCATALHLAERRLAAGRLPALAAYAALPDELDLDGLLSAWWAKGRMIYLPRVDGVSLRWHALASATALQPGAYGIREADPAKAPASALPPGTLLLLPGLGFCVDGRRLGQGGGYYDRYLPGAGVVAVGVGFSCQECDDLPCDEQDVRVQGLILGGRLRLDPP